MKTDLFTLTLLIIWFLVFQAALMYYGYLAWFKPKKFNELINDRLVTLGLFPWREKTWYMWIVRVISAIGVVLTIIILIIVIGNYR